MTHLLSLGAINKNTDKYVYPKIANKKDDYICPHCNKDVFPRQGKLLRHHFAHKRTDNPCNYYNNPGETQIHKDGKMLLKHLLETKIPLSFVRKCSSCQNDKIFEIPEINKRTSIQLEYRFEYNESVKIADIAYIDDKFIKYIFEICNTHKTCSENRPEPWFEIDAITLINMVNDIKITSFEIPCIRCEKCEECVYMENLRINDLDKWIRIKLGQCFKNPKYIDEYHEKNDHERFDFSACNPINSNNCIHENNKKICEIFINDLNTYRIILDVWKGGSVGYIVSKKIYDSINWGDHMNSDGILYKKCLYTKEYTGYGTVRILEDLINNSFKLKKIL
jgi:hypothetical protein